MNLLEYPDAEMMMIDVAEKIAGDLANALTNHDWASFAVPGGTTPGPIFDDLAGADLHWDRIHVIPTDERWVPETSDRSNTRLVRERLLIDKAASAKFIPLYRGTATPEEAVDAVAAAIAPELPLSVLLLGMGEDMHTASLFPGADNLDAALDRHAPPVMAMRAPGAAEPRITLTAPVLRDAMAIHVVITGAAKREALERARHLKPHEAPIAAVLHDATVHWAE